MEGYRAVITEYDVESKMGRVTISKLNNAVSGKIPVLMNSMASVILSGDYNISVADPVDPVSGNGSVSGEVALEGVPMFSVGDNVAVIFFGDSLADGVILGKVGGA